jgi:hypothetical protein
MRWAPRPFVAGRLRQRFKFGPKHAVVIGLGKNAIRRKRPRKTRQKR